MWGAGSTTGRRTIMAMVGAPKKAGRQTPPRPWVPLPSPSLPHARSSPHFLLSPPLPRPSVSLRLSSTRTVPTTTWTCTTGRTAWLPSSAASAAARSRIPWWPQAAACFSGFTRTPRCRGRASRLCTAQVRGWWLQAEHLSRQGKGEGVARSNIPV